MKLTIVGAAFSVAASPALAAGSASVAAASGASSGVEILLPDSARNQAIECLATAISYEAGNQPEAGQEAVAQVILNRLHNPAFPKSVCAIVYQGSTRRTGCQFSFTCDGSMLRWRPGRALVEARRIAALAVDGELVSAIGAATHYHADYVQPAWAARMTRVTQIGAHIFYRAADGTPLPRAASRSGEAVPAPPPPRQATLSVWGLQAAVLVPVGNAIAVGRN